MYRKASPRHLNKDLRKGTMGLFGGTMFQARGQPVQDPEEHIGCVQEAGSE